MAVEFFKSRQKTALLEELREALLDVAPGEDVVFTSLAPERSVTSVRIQREEDTGQTSVRVDRLLYVSEFVIGEKDAFIRFVSGYLDQFRRHRGIQARILSGSEYIAQTVRQRRLPSGLPPQVNEVKAVLQVVREGFAIRRARAVA